MLAQYMEGQIAADFLYGYTYLKTFHEEVSLEEYDGHFDSSFVKRTLKFLERAFGSFLLCRVWFERLILNRSKLFENSILLTNIDSIALSFAFGRWFFGSRSQIVHISQGLTNKLDVCESPGLVLNLQKCLTATLCGQLDQLIVLGKGALKSYRSNRIVENSRISLVQFGVDTQFWYPELHRSRVRERYILSVGSDAGRDYESLLNCRLPGPLKIVSRLPIERQKGVEQLSDVSDSELRELYQNAAFVVITLKDIPQPTGQSATLQAMACGKPVILTQTRGLWDESKLRSSRDFILVPSGDIETLELTISSLWKQPDRCEKMGIEARKRVEEHFDISNFGDALSKVCVSVHQSKMRMLV